MTDSITLVFAPITLPVGTKKRGYWTQYEALDKAGKTQITVTPHLTVCDISCASWPLTTFDLYMHYTPQEWDTDTFNLIYTDEAFEEAVGEWARANGLEACLGTPFYTEAGMQGADYVSMEFGSRKAHLTQHEVLRILKMARDTKASVRIHEDVAA